MTAPEPLQEWTWLARIRRPQGRKGEVFADILTDFPEKFAGRRRLWLVADPEAPQSKSNPATVKGMGFSPYIQFAERKGALAPAESPPVFPREVELQAHWLHKGGIVLHFAHSDSISAAESLTGLIVAIPFAERVQLSADEVYIADLIGCTLFDVAGPVAIIVGQIEDVDRSAGPVALLVVRRLGSGEEILVPFAKSYLRTIDLAARRVEMSLPEGLANLNAPGNR